MTRVTEFPEDERKPLGEKAAGGDPGAAGERTLVRLPSLPVGRRIADFYSGVKMEMRKTTWPTRTEVWSTTVVVIIAVIFFGFYLWGVDRLVTLGFRYLEKVIR